MSVSDLTGMSGALLDFIDFICIIVGLPSQRPVISAALALAANLLSSVVIIAVFCRFTFAVLDFGPCCRHLDAAPFRIRASNGVPGRSVSVASAPQSSAHLQRMIDVRAAAASQHSRDLCNADTRPASAIRVRLGSCEHVPARPALVLPWVAGGVIPCVRDTEAHGRAEGFCRQHSLFLD